MKATVDDLDRQQLEAIVEYLRQVSGDVSLTLKRTEPGSVKLVLEGSEDGFKRIEALFSSGQLNEILGIPVQDVSYAVSKRRVRNSQALVLAVAGGVGVNVSTDIAQHWLLRLRVDCPQQSAANRESIVRWLLGNNLDAESTSRGSSPSTEVQEAIRVGIARQAMEYRYRILQQRYLGVSSHQAYRNLTTRLSSLTLLRNKIRTWVSLSGDRQRTIKDILQEVIQELLQSDRYMQQQITSIVKCTDDRRLRNALLFASMEEYCLRPIRNQPLIVYRFVNYLRRTARGGLTHVPNSDLIRLLTVEELLTDNSENLFIPLDTQAIAAYLDTQVMEEKQALWNAVKQEFSSSLEEQLGSVAVQWLHLYLQGNSQEAIARSLNLDIEQVYRLREKVSYHAVQVFALKQQPELVSNWLETSLQEHNLGLMPQQWQQFWENLTPQQRQIIELLKADSSMEAIAQALKLETHQVMVEWGKLYLAAQALRWG